MFTISTCSRVSSISHYHANVLQGPSTIESTPHAAPTTTSSSPRNSKSENELQQALEKASQQIAEVRSTSDELQRQLEERSLEITEVKEINRQLQYELDVSCLPCLTMVSQATL